MRTGIDVGYEENGVVQAFYGHVVLFLASWGWNRNTVRFPSLLRM